ncbi:MULTISPECIES: GNAT family N-acetyltransferase [Thermoanaerobacter]|uniref:N-acetylglutamate synthase-like GNAT family acetyltransferase n=1 Tax=Thermoanaerobacter pentosaceus TaxID=694059 RepID=A0ABT9M0V4_9THEO|nr:MULTISPECIES: GNAT family N-acetyltransferase [Thermoanaerobacter]MDP9749721.1 N-acetylglutamate synthase-like GNAT family acetyltransferase [Thermoanaerobacter pentosaceus]
MFSIKFAKAEDFETIKKIANECGIKGPLNFLEEIFMVAREDKPFAFISMKVENNNAIISNLAILPSYRDKGFENLMVRAVLNHALDMGLENACVNMPFYKDFFCKLGFMEKGDFQMVKLKEFFRE